MKAGRKKIITRAFHSAALIDLDPESFTTPEYFSSFFSPFSGALGLVHMSRMSSGISFNRNWLTFGLWA